MVIMIKRSRFRSNGRSLAEKGVTISLTYFSGSTTAMIRYLTGRGEGGNLGSDRHWLPGTAGLMTKPFDHPRRNG